MILQRLYALALREKLLDDPAFESRPVPWVVSVGPDGSYLGLEERRPGVTLPSKKKDAPPRTVPGKGEPMNVPRAHGNTANPGFARYFADTLPRVLPVRVADDDQKKADASRATFWNQIGEAAVATADPALLALRAFGARLDEFADRIRADVGGHDPALTELVTFAYQPDGGRTIVHSPAVRAWYTSFFARVNGTKQAAGPVGVCQVTGEIGPLPTTHPTKLQGVPGGMSVGVSLISFDKPAFGHYGLEGAANAGVGYPATDGYLRALDALLRNTLPTGNSSLRVGGTAFLYWTRDPADVGFMSLFDDPTEDQLKHLPKPRVRGRVEAVFDAAATGTKVADRAIDANQFYVLGLSGNAARAVVRGYLENSLADAKANIAQWFADLRIADTSKDYAGRENDKFPLSWLAGSTLPRKAGNPDWDKLPDDVPRALLEAALDGGPVGDSSLAACLRRLAVEGADGFRPPRMALIKLILIRKGIHVDPQQVPDKPEHAAYVYGRFLAVCEDIQRAALGKVNANIVDRYYGRLSTAPAFILRRMIDGALDHLKKLRTTKESLAVHLDQRLAVVVALMPKDPLTGQMSFEDQARFSIGYYHEKAAGYARIADRKRKKAEQQAKAGAN